MRASDFLPVTLRAGYICYVAGITLFGFRERELAIVTQHRVRFLQFRINPDSAIEDETFALVVRATAFFEVF